MKCCVKVSFTFYFWNIMQLWWTLSLKPLQYILQRCRFNTLQRINMKDNIWAVAVVANPMTLSGDVYFVQCWSCGCYRQWFFWIYVYSHHCHHMQKNWNTTTYVRYYLVYMSVIWNFESSRSLCSDSNIIFLANLIMQKRLAIQQSTK